MSLFLVPAVAPSAKINSAPPRHNGPTAEQMVKTLVYIGKKGARELRLDMDWGIRIKTILSNADVELGGRGVESLRDSSGKTIIRYVRLDKSTQTTLYYDYQRALFGMNSLDNLEKLHRARTAAQPPHTET